MKKNYLLYFILISLSLSFFSCSNFLGDTEYIPTESMGETETTVTNFDEIKDFNMVGYFDDYNNNANLGKSTSVNFCTDGTRTQVQLLNYPEHELNGNYYIKKINAKKIPERLKTLLHDGRPQYSVIKNEYYAISKSPIKYVKISLGNGIEVEGTDFLFTFSYLDSEDDYDSITCCVFGKICSYNVNVHKLILENQIPSYLLDKLDLKYLPKLGTLRTYNESYYNTNYEDLIFEYESLNEKFINKLETMLGETPEYLINAKELSGIIIDPKYKYLYIGVTSESYELSDKYYRVGLSNEKFEHIYSPKSFRYTDVLSHDEFVNLCDIETSHNITDIKQYSGIWKPTDYSNSILLINSDGKSGVIIIRLGNESINYECSFIKKDDATYIKYKDKNNEEKEYFVFVQSPTEIIIDGTLYNKQGYTIDDLSSTLTNFIEPNLDNILYSKNFYLNSEANSEIPDGYATFAMKNDIVQISKKDLNKKYNFTNIKEINFTQLPKLFKDKYQKNKNDKFYVFGKKPFTNDTKIQVQYNESSSKLNLSDGYYIFGNIGDRYFISSASSFSYISNILNVNNKVELPKYLANCNKLKNIGNCIGTYNKDYYYAFEYEGSINQNFINNLEQYFDVNKTSINSLVPITCSTNTYLEIKGRTGGYYITLSDSNVEDIYDNKSCRITTHISEEKFDLLFVGIITADTHSKIDSILPVTNLNFDSATFKQGDSSLILSANNNVIHSNEGDNVNLVEYKYIYEISYKDLPKAWQDKNITPNARYILYSPSYISVPLTINMDIQRNQLSIDGKNDINILVVDKNEATIFTKNSKYVYSNSIYPYPVNKDIPRTITEDRNIYEKFKEIGNLTNIYTNTSHSSTTILFEYSGLKTEYKDKLESNKGSNIAINSNEYDCPVVDSSYTYLEVGKQNNEYLIKLSHPNIISLGTDSSNTNANKINITTEQDVKDFLGIIDVKPEVCLSGMWRGRDNSIILINDDNATGNYISPKSVYSPLVITKDQFGINFSVNNDTPVLLLEVTDKSFIYKQITYNKEIISTEELEFEKAFQKDILWKADLKVSGTVLDSYYIKITDIVTNEMIYRENNLVGENQENKDGIKGKYFITPHGSVDFDYPTGETTSTSITLPEVEKYDANSVTIKHYAPYDQMVFNKVDKMDEIKPKDILKDFETAFGENQLWKMDVSYQNTLYYVMYIKILDKASHKVLYLDPEIAQTNPEGIECTYALTPGNDNIKFTFSSEPSEPQRDFYLPSNIVSYNTNEIFLAPLPDLPSDSDFLVFKKATSIDQGAFPKLPEMTENDFETAFGVNQQWTSSISIEDQKLTCSIKLTNLTSNELDYNINGEEGHGSYEIVENLIIIKNANNKEVLSLPPIVNHTSNSITLFFSPLMFVEKIVFTK